MIESKGESERNIECVQTSILSYSTPGHSSRSSKLLLSRYPGARITGNEYRAACSNNIRPRYSLYTITNHVPPPRYTVLRFYYQFVDPIWRRRRDLNDCSRLINSAYRWLERANGVQHGVPGSSSSSSCETTTAAGGSEGGGGEGDRGGGGEGDRGGESGSGDNARGQCIIKDYLCVVPVRHTDTCACVRVRVLLVSLPCEYRDNNNTAVPFSVRVRIAVVFVVRQSFSSRPPCPAAQMDDETPTVRCRFVVVRDDAADWTRQRSRLISVLVRRRCASCDNVPCRVLLFVLVWSVFYATRVTPTAAVMEETKVIYHIDDEDTPYLVKLPIAADKVTLADFKNVLNRPNYKFFFKSMDDDFGLVIRTEGIVFVLLLFTLIYYPLWVTPSPYKLVCLLHRNYPQTWKILKDHDHTSCVSLTLTVHCLGWY